MPEEKTNAEKYLHTIVSSIVSNVEGIKIVRSVDELGVLLSLTVAKEDMGKIIGREGTTANAIRNLVRIVGMKENSRINVKISEPTSSGYDGGHSRQYKSLDEALEKHI